MLQDLKDYLKITWDDEDGSLNKLISRGQSHLNGLCGITLDFETEGDPKALLLDYCRYAYNNSLEYFEGNFSGQILRLQLDAGISLLPPKEV